MSVFPTHFEYLASLQQSNSEADASRFTQGQYLITLISQALHYPGVMAVQDVIKQFASVADVYLHPMSEQVSCKGVVISIDIADESLSLLKQALVAKAQELKIDIAVSVAPPSLSKPGLLVMDMDSTMIQLECIDEIARLAGRFDEVSTVTARAMQGQLDFAESLRTRVACLNGVEEAALLKIKQSIPLMPGLVNMIKLLRQYKWKLAIASGGFTYFADHLKQWLELDDAFSNTLELHDGKLTGKTCGSIVDATAKAEILLRLQEKYAIESTQTVAMGDGANDLKMIYKAHLGVAFHAKETVQPKADVAVNYQSLDALLLLLRP